MSNYCRGHGPANAKLLLVLEAPGKEEDKIGLTLVGPTRDQIDEFLLEAGFPGGIDATYRTNVYKYRPPDNNIKRIKEVLPNGDTESSVKELFQEIHAINPNVIMAVGDVALKALTGKTGIGHYRGSLLLSRTGHKVVPTIHPASIFKKDGAYKYSARVYILEDFKKAVIESEIRELNLPKRKLNIIRRPEELLNFFRGYSRNIEFASDIEVFKAIPTCISFSFDPSYAISVPLVNLKPSDRFPKIEPYVFVQFYRIIQEFFNERKRIIGQNWKFDHQKLERPFGFALADPYLDTSLLQHTLFPELPKSLEFLASVYTREPYYKSELKEFDYRKSNVEDLYTYNAKDSAVTLEVSYVLRTILKEFCEKYPWLESFFYEYVMRLHPLYMELESYGLKVNFNTRQELYDKYWDLHKRAEKTLHDLGFPLKFDKKDGHCITTTSPKEVSNFIINIMKMPHRDDMGETTLTMLLANHASKEEQKRACITVLDKRRFDRTLSASILSEPDTDDRMRTSYNIAGTETGRSSTRVLKPPVRPFRNIGISYHGMTKHGDIGQDVGYMYEADEGYEFIDADLSQAEPRTVALLSEDYDLLGRFDTSDIHKESAGICFGLSDSDAQLMLKSDLRRFVGKTCKNGANYEMGKGEMARTINTDARKFHIDIRVSEKETGVMLDRIHARYPKVRGIFHEQVKRALMDNDLVLVNAFGRVRTHFEKWGEQLFKSAYAQIPQSTIADKLKMSMLKIKKIKPSMMIVAEKHDAITVLSKLSERAENCQIIKEVFEEPIDFSRCSLPREPLKIPCEIEIGVRYNDWKKWDG